MPYTAPTIATMNASSTAYTASTWRQQSPTRAASNSVFEYEPPPEKRPDVLIPVGRTRNEPSGRIGKKPTTKNFVVTYEPSLAGWRAPMNLVPIPLYLDGIADLDLTRRA